MKNSHAYSADVWIDLPDGTNYSGGGGAVYEGWAVPGEGLAREAVWAVATCPKLDRENLLEWERRMDATSAGDHFTRMVEHLGREK